MASDGSIITILVVEDEPLPRMDLAEQLIAAGYEVCEASSGEEALAHLQNGQRIDVLITDIQLGGRVTGWDLAEKFRAAHARIPVVYTSGKPPDHDRKVSGSVFFSKPVRAIDVVRTCRSFGGAVPDR